MKKCRYILLYIYVFLISLSVSSTNWAINKFAFLSFDEAIFQLTSPIKSAEKSILTSFVADSLFIAVMCSLIFFGLLVLILNYLDCKQINLEIKLWKKKILFGIKSSILKLLLKLTVIICTIYIIYSCLNRIGFINYLYNQIHESLFIEEHYVNPNDIKLTFPSKKRNLIYIYVESLESTYFSKDLGGETDYNLLQPITELTAKNISFSDTNKFGGAMSVPGTTWTTGAMVAQTSGLPLMVSGEFATENRLSSMLSGATTLGDILEANGYNQMYMIGSDKSFGNRDIYFKEHGNYKIYDYNVAKKKNKISDDYYVWWGYEDSKLFEYAKEEITNLAKKDKPFNFTMLTTDTHFTDGYLENTCVQRFGIQYYDVIYCSAGQIQEFANWISQQSFYKDTTVIIVGDHISMQSGIYPEDADRRVYNLFINPAVTEGRFVNRKFSTMDLFPTTLASIGVEIEGDRLGLGTNLFSDKDTLVEEYGYDYFANEMSRYSKFYMKEFLNK